MSRSGQRFVGVCGIAFAILGVLVVILPYPPAPDSAAGDAAGYYDVHRSAFLALNYLGALGLLPFLVFIAGLTHMFKHAEGDSVHMGQGTLNALALAARDRRA